MSLLLLSIKFKLHSLFHRVSIYSKQEQPRVWVFLAADYGNLGDVAITYAQEKLLKERFPEYEIVDIPISKTLIYLHNIKHIVGNDDIITITGGGNMGEMYGDIELLRLMVVKAFPNNRVMVFPQTIDYVDNDSYLFRKAKKIYNLHKKLTIMERESVSYEKACKWFGRATNILTPDVVMTLDEWGSEERQGVVFCLRDDKEKIDSSDCVNDIINQITQQGISISRYDTHIGYGNLSMEEREKQLYMIWRAFRRARLVVTDRLHGMIFAYITGTPTIVLPNKNFKIAKCYEWIKDCGYIFFAPEGKFALDELLRIKLDRKVFVKLLNIFKGEFNL